jgi:hypothetical protein
MESKKKRGGGPSKPSKVVRKTRRRRCEKQAECQRMMIAGVAEQEQDHPRPNICCGRYGCKVVSDDE